MSEGILLESAPAKNGKPITLSLGAAVGIVATCLIPGLGAWFRMEAVVGNMNKTLDRLVSKVEALNDDVVRLKAWQEGAVKPGGSSK